MARFDVITDDHDMRGGAEPGQVGGAQVAITYGEVVDALQAAITAHPQGGAAGPIAVYDLSDDNEAARLRAELTAAWDGAGPPPQVARVAQQDSAEEEDEGILEIDPAAGIAQRELDLEKAAMILLTDYRSGKLGRISLETPESRAAMLAGATVSTGKAPRRAAETDF